MSNLTQMFDLLEGAFPQFSPNEVQLRAWHSALAEYDSETLERAAMRHIEDSKYPPTISEIRKRAVEHRIWLKESQGTDPKILAQQKLANFLLRLSRRFSLAGDNDSSGVCYRLANEQLEGRGMEISDRLWVQEWFNALCELDRKIAPTMHERAERLHYPNAVWRPGSALDLTDEQVDKRIADIAPFLAQMKRSHYTIETLVDHVASEAPKARATDFRDVMPDGS